MPKDLRSLRNETRRSPASRRHLVSASQQRPVGLRENSAWRPDLHWNWEKIAHVNIKSNKKDDSSSHSCERYVNIHRQLIMAKYIPLVRAGNRTRWELAGWVLMWFQREFWVSWMDSSPIYNPTLGKLILTLREMSFITHPKEIFMGNIIISYKHIY